VEKEQIQERIKEIEAAMQQPDFWSDKNDAQALIKELHDLKAEAEGGNAYDRRGSIVSLVAGAGGDDAEDFARMLFEMYRKYFEKRGWSARILHENKNDHGGFRNMSIEVVGKNVYGTIKHEYGVHRLVRISPFNASQKRHTSFVLVDATGKTRCEIGVEPDGSFLALNDAMGNARILLGVNGDKARVVVAGLNSRASAGIAVYEQSPVVVLKDGNGAVRANMGILPDSGPWVALQDGNGNQTWSTDGRR